MALGSLKGAMIDHLALELRDYPRSKDSYLAPLGIELLAEFGDGAG